MECEDEFKSNKYVVLDCNVQINKHLHFTHTQDIDEMLHANDTSL